MKKLNILSLFDGISVARLVLHNLNIPINKYYASEIDPNAIAISQKNWKDIAQLGDIEKWKEWDIDWSSIDFVCGGSPCQGFSFSGKGLNFEDPRSKLFFVFADIVNYAKTKNPNLTFFLENVRMKTEYEQVITDHLGVEPTLLDSALVSAQTRKRLYWSNKTFSAPEDQQISVHSIIGENNYAGAMRGRRLDERGKRVDSRLDIPIQQMIEWKSYPKSNCLTTVAKDNVVVFGEQKGKYFIANTNKDKWRMLTIEEIEQLQTLPIDYTNNGKLGHNARVKLIGNSWTVNMIEHIFKEILQGENKL